MNTKPLRPSDTVFGYTLEERIGSGGYGDVWSAIAPGGIKKAIKFVYGFHDERRAQTEIKALDRVKQIRHPFLLSLERMDVVDGQLVIITELADGCLADVFSRYSEQGSPGIPREELLGYMRDAADALDYMTTYHSLQHLDIKPENLLLVGRHLKIADFGLVKELKNTGQSLLTGMTPTYAAPELFDGKPSENSDQYSLAIVFQEMLTSTRPFAGTTVAQLATQHTHGRPDLQSLSVHDQRVIGRALSKDPAARYPNCSLMIAELMQNNGRRKTARRSSSMSEQALVCTDSLVEIDTAVLDTDTVPSHFSDLKPAGLPDVDERPATVKPMLIVSVGGLARQAALKFKQRLAARHGSSDALPSVRVICVDSDQSSLLEQCQSDGVRLKESEILPTPLQRPEVYRDKAKSRLGWLGRRWIYNIPRSMQTEGLRPLGRLALVDHYEAVCGKLQKAIEEIRLEENLSATADTVGIEPGDPTQIQVFLVSSSSGGIGGMTLDLAYALRDLLCQNGCQPDELYGVLMHASDRKQIDPSLAVANSFAMLTELRHYTEYGYPGDPWVGLPEFPNEPPFDRTYYLELGDDLSSTDLDRQMNSIAEWIYLNGLSPCSVFFNACRSRTKESEFFDLHTFGLSICGPGQNTASSTQAQMLIAALVDKWIGNDSNGSQPEQDPSNTQQCESLPGVEQATQLVDRQLRESVDETWFAQLVDQSRERLAQQQDCVASVLQNFYDQQLGVDKSRQEIGYVEPELVVQLRDRVGLEAEPICNLIASSTLESLQGERFELASASQLIKQMYSVVKEARDQLEQRFIECETKIGELATVIQGARANSKKEEVVVQCLQSYRDLKWQSFVIKNTRYFYQCLQSNVTAISDEVGKNVDRLVQFSSEVGLSDFAIATPATDEFRLEQWMSDSVIQNRDRLLQQLERLVLEEFAANRGGFSATMNDPYFSSEQLYHHLKQLAIRVITNSYAKLSIDEVIQHHQIDQQRVCDWLREQIYLAQPRVNRAGGESRLLVGLPRHAGDSKLPELIDEQFPWTPKGINGTWGDLVLCVECDELLLAGVANRLLDLQPDAIEITKRIHCRNDVNWSSLSDLI